MMGSRNKILGSGGTFYPTYLDPLVSICCIFSLRWSATPVKTNGYLRYLNQLLRLDILYRMVPQLTLFDFYFL